MNIEQPEQGIPLPMLSDEAAVEILYFLEATFQIFETHYANQIARFYESLAHRNVVQSDPTNDDPPF